MPRGEYRLAAASKAPKRRARRRTCRVLRLEGPPVRHAPRERAGPAALMRRAGAGLGRAAVARVARSGPAQEAAAARASVLWAPLFADDLPIQLVLGDYYIFGERDEAGGIRRLMRDFDVNSRGRPGAALHRRSGAGRAVRGPESGLPAHFQRAGAARGVAGAGRHRASMCQPDAGLGARSFHHQDHAHRLHRLPERAGHADGRGDGRFALFIRRLLSTN